MRSQILDLGKKIPNFIICTRVSVQGVKSLGGHFACSCRGFDLKYEVIEVNFSSKKKMEILLHF